MKITITGHRPNKLGNDYDLTSDLIKKIDSKLQKLIDELKPDTLISGMALGIDTLWAEISIRNNIPLLAAIPCQNQDKMWVKKSKDRYNNILSNHLTTSVYVSDKPYDYSCMQKRNEYMVNNSDIVIAVWDGTTGGTANCVKYTKKVNKQIIIINPKEL